MTASSAPNPFGLGTQVFGEEPQPPPVDEPKGDVSEESSEDEDEDEALVTAMAVTTLDASEWKTAPSYACLYMSTGAEYVPPAPKPKLPPGAQVETADDDKSSTDKTWALEGYENSLDVDHVFERFTKRVGYEGAQCIRSVSAGYEHLGVSFDVHISTDTSSGGRHFRLPATRSLTGCFPHLHHRICL